MQVRYPEKCRKILFIVIIVEGKPCKCRRPERKHGLVSTVNVGDFLRKSLVHVYRYVTYRMLCLVRTCRSFRSCPVYIKMRPVMISAALSARLINGTALPSMGFIWFLQMIEVVNQALHYINTYDVHPTILGFPITPATLRIMKGYLVAAGTLYVTQLVRGKAAGK